MNPSARQVFSDPILFLGFGFGSGLAPKAPGTAGTAMAMPFLCLALSYLDATGFLLVTAMISLVGVPICGLSSKKLGVHDHGGIVWDEFAGLFVTAIPLLLWPIASNFGLALLLAFLWFRLFDVLKPWPISYLDKHVHGGLGIMLDDLLAGVFAAAALWASLKLLS
ncbi:MAG: phosphatidylglycerophosphatase A family protein [Oceanococcus sp.]